MAVNSLTPEQKNITLLSQASENFQESNTSDTILNVSFVPLEIPPCSAYIKTHCLQQQRQKREGENNRLAAHYKMHHSTPEWLTFNIITALTRAEQSTASSCQACMEWHN